MEEAVPVTKELISGVVAWVQLALAISMGSRFGREGPDCWMTLPPTADAVPALAWEVAFWLLPGVVPALLTEALAGPAVTVVETPRAKPPASASRTAASAICG